MEATKYNQFIELISERYSCRGYKNEPLDNELIMKVLEGVRLAPSACNRQPWKFLIITSEEGRNKIAECYNRDWIKTAPAFIVAMGDHSTAWHRADDNKDHTNVDLAIAVEHLCLTAKTLGLGTCWICNFDWKRFNELFAPPENWEAIAIIPIGYPETDNTPKKVRKSLDEIITWEKL